MRLQLTRRGDYAVRAMIALAGTNGRGPISARLIAERMSIPPRFLPQVMHDLTAAGLVEAQQGRAGGYRLARSPESIALLQVIEAVEGDTRRQTCVMRGAPCGRDGQCAVHDIFLAAQAAILERLAATSLGQLASRLGS